MTQRWKQAPANSNWGQFGADDQRGRMNLVGPAQVLSGIAEVKTGQTFSLSLPLDFPGGNALNPARFPPRLVSTRRGGPEGPENYVLGLDYLEPNATDVVCDDIAILATQYSTQWDSFAHVGSYFDADGDGVNGSLKIDIIDDVPIAFDDVDLVDADEAGLFADGNVLTGVGGSDANASDGAADVQGADGAIVTDVAFGGNAGVLGHLASTFPKASLVEVVRDPRDVALSMWQTTFGSQGMYFTFDQREMAFELNAYRQYMLAWEQIFPGRIHEINYETLVGDVSAESRRIADICGLEWVDAMERPHENVKAVRTASITQVRSPVSTKSVGRWKKHAGALKEFIAGLEPTLWPDL